MRTTIAMGIALVIGLTTAIPSLADNHQRLSFSHMVAEDYNYSGNILERRMVGIKIEITDEFRDMTCASCQVSKPDFLVQRNVDGDWLRVDECRIGSFHMNINYTYEASVWCPMYTSEYYDNGMVGSVSIEGEQLRSRLTYVYRHPVTGKKKVRKYWFNFTNPGYRPPAVNFGVPQTPSWIADSVED